MGSSTATWGVPGADPAGVDGAALAFAFDLAVALGAGAAGSPSASGSIVPCRPPPILVV